jgi:hypothetical protein
MASLQRLFAPMAIASLLLTGALSVSSAGATTIRQDPALHKLLLANPYPGWPTVPQALQLRAWGSILRPLESRGIRLSFGSWVTPDGSGALFIWLMNRRGLPSGFIQGFGGDLCSGVGATARTTGGVIPDARVSLLGTCSHQHDGGAITFAMAETRTTVEFLGSDGPGSLSKSQLQQIAARQFQALR